MDSSRRYWRLQEFVAHKANVNCLAMGHKSNQVLATGGDDKKVNLWAIGRQSCLMSLSGHTTPVECVCFGHSEDLVCAGSQTGVLKIWDLEAAKLLRTFMGHKGAVKCMDFHPYGDYLATGCCDSSIKLWDTRKRGCIKTYSGHRLAVNTLQCSPDGQWIASACEDGFVKVWDVRIGRVLQEFVEHTAAVTCIKFHPHEFLLASCGSDKVVNFWDMEKFQLVSKFEKENTPIRYMMFSEDGSALLGCGGDGLTVVAWEPARTLDTVAAHFAHVHDMTLAHTQLIMGSFSSTNVILSVVDLSKLYPFGGPPPMDLSSFKDTSPFQKGQSLRKSFSKEKPTKAVLHHRTLLDEKTMEESTSGTEPDEESGAVITNVRDYTEIFQPSKALPRTPPPIESLTSEECTYPDASTSTSLQDLMIERSPPPARPAPPASPPQRHCANTSTEPAHKQIYSPENKNMLTQVMDNKEVKLEIQTTFTRNYDASALTMSSLNRRNSYKEAKSQTNFSTCNLRASNSEISLGPTSLGSRSLSFTRTAKQSTRLMESEEAGRESAPPSPSSVAPETELVPVATDRPVGLHLDDFIPRGSARGGGVAGGEPSEQEVIGGMMRGHEPVMAVLRARQRAMQIFHSVRINKSLKAALESVIALEDLSVIVDILNVMAHKPSLWNLDICLLMLPKICELLQSKYESYMQCGCNALRLIVRNFASVVVSNAAGGTGGIGVDIEREERVGKCVRIHRLLGDARALLLRRRAAPRPRIAAACRDLLALMHQALD